MKNKTILKILILFFTITVFSQAENDKNKKDAVDFLNLFLSHESWAMKVDANFTYNKYSNSLAFKSIIELDDEKKSILKEEYMLGINNIKSIDEIIYNEKNIIFYKIHLVNEIYLKRHNKKNGDVIPDYTEKKVKEVSIDFYKPKTDQDLKNIQKVIRDIFSNIPIETEYIKL